MATPKATAAKAAALSRTSPTETGNCGGFAPRARAARSTRVGAPDLVGGPSSPADALVGGRSSPADALVGGRSSPADALVGGRTTAVTRDRGSVRASAMSLGLAT